MGKGIEAAKWLSMQAGESPLHAEVLDDFKDQLLVAMVVKAGGQLVLPVADVDATGEWVLEFKIVDRAFHFKARRKG